MVEGRIVGGWAQTMTAMSFCSCSRMSARRTGRTRGEAARLTEWRLVGPACCRGSPHRCRRPSRPKATGSEAPGGQ